MNARALARAILSLCAASAVAAALGAWTVVSSAGPEAQMAEGWRMIGFATFALLFGLLAWNPSRSVGLWVAVIANKALLAVAAATVWSQSEGAREALMWDASLTVALVVAFVLASPWRGPRSVPSATPMQAVAA